MENLKVDEDDLDEEVAGRRRRRVTAAGRGSDRRGVTGGAAGLKELLSGFKAAAMNVLNFTTYFEMKARAGTVGKKGVGSADRSAGAAGAAHPPGRPQLRRPRRGGGGGQLDQRQDREHEPAADGVFAQRLLASR